MDITIERRTVATVLGALGLVGGIGLLTTLLLGDEQAPAHAAPASMNSDQARRITQSPHRGTMALPVDSPRADFLFVTRVERDRFEMAFQHGGLQIVICDQPDDVDSACSGDGVRMLRDEVVDGRRVRVAEMGIAVDLATHVATESEPHHVAVYEYWTGVTLARGEVPAWLEEQVLPQE
ncbi:MAG: hypothetical protein K0R97_732 [Oerskovia sp.]|jgi:hypothetical protein|nr:hypothetical protein [Oerskovia sp.]